MYQTGASSGIPDLLDKIGNAVVTQGWAQNRRDAVSLSISKGNVFQNYFDNGTEIHLSAATGFNAGSAWNAQPGASSYVQKAKNMDGSFASYHLFITGDYVHVVVEVDPGLYRHFACGQSVIDSVNNDGQYSAAGIFDASKVWRGTLFGGIQIESQAWYSESSVLLLDFESSNIRVWRPFTGAGSAIPALVRSTDRMTNLFGKYQLFADWFDYSTPNTLNGLSALLPIYLFVDRPDNLMSPLGYIKDLRVVNMINFDPGETITLGSNQWKVFPKSVKSSAGDYSTGNYGYAYKIVP